ncbi:MAG: metallophosphoesterase [Desulfovibrionaceae bacterium]|nr:metallophosphoesterase [Desulfovibrionaceae bacterium]
MEDCEKYWIVLGDIHDRFEQCASIPELDGAEGFIISGDLTNVGSVSQASRVMQFLRSLKAFVWAQIGNMDRPEIDTWLTKENCNLHCTVRELLPNTAMFGVGGSIFTPFATPSEFSESDFALWLERCWKKAQNYPHTILVSHNPPFDTLCDRINSGQHVGSTAVKEFIESEQPDLCICGHIHESRAQTKIGRTYIVNPGAFVHGEYALLKKSREDKFSAELCSLQK